MCANTCIDTRPDGLLFAGCLVKLSCSFFLFRKNPDILSCLQFCLRWLYDAFGRLHAMAFTYDSRRLEKSGRYIIDYQMENQLPCLARSLGSGIWAFLIESLIAKQRPNKPTPCRSAFSLFSSTLLQYLPEDRSMINIYSL